jgi:hypothetical protein
MKYLIPIVALSAALSACNPFAPAYEWEVKECRYDLSKLPNYVEMEPGARLAFIDKCMADKGWMPTEKCHAARAEGKTHCAYERKG